MLARQPFIADIVAKSFPGERALANLANSLYFLVTAEIGPGYYPGMRVQKIVALITLCTPMICFAAGITDYSSHKVPTITMPKKGGSYIDPVFGTKVIRVTDSSNGSICTHAYSYWPAFNHEDTRLLVMCDNLALLYKFDPATDTLTPDGTLQGADGPHVQMEGATWSYSSPDILFAIDQMGTRLWKMDVSRRGAAGYTLLKDFKNWVPATAYIKALTTDVSGNVFSFYTADRATGTPLRGVVWVRNIDKVYLYPPVTNHVFNETKIDKTGTYQMLNFDDSTMALWDFRSNTTQWFYYGNPNDDVNGHFDIGADFIANSGAWHSGAVTRTFSDLRPPAWLVKYLRTDGTQNWTICDHVSLRVLNEVFLVGSTYLGDNTHQPFENEVYLAYLDGHGFVRLAHTRSVNNVFYYSQPRATVDMKGRYIVFTSDLGQSNRTDVMIVKIPSQYWP